ncbi:MAG: sulfatase [Actinomycetales bacterium]
MTLRRQISVAVTASVTALAVVAGTFAIGTFGGSTLGAASAAETTLTTGAGRPSFGVPGAVPQQGLTPSQVPANPTVTGSLADIRNVVVVLADDLDWTTFDSVPRLAALKEQGTTFVNYVATDPVCCPSRASLLRGQYVHNHKVISNTDATGGGWPTYYRDGDEADSLPIWLQAAGASTALFGKYLNEYPDGAPSKAYVPPGWTRWASPISGEPSYACYNYVLNRNGVLKRYGSAPKDFLNDVLTIDAVDFVSTSPEPFFLLFSTFNPHHPFPIAKRHAKLYSDAVLPKGASFNRFGYDEPKWLKAFPIMRQPKIRVLERMWKKRLRSTESIADSVDALLAALDASGRRADTLVMVTSDNGYHLGMRRMPRGKRTPYRDDALLPMVLIGPGIPQGLTVDAMTSTIDIAPTLLELMKGSAPSWLDGRSWVPLLNGESGQPGSPQPWRTGVLTESLSVSDPGDPDFERYQPPRFKALRTNRWFYVTYESGEVELYDRSFDPYEMVNLASRADPALLQALEQQTQALATCAGPTCREADSLTAAGN